MLLAADSTLPFPRDVVFRAYRDHLVELVEFLPNIRAIEQISREEEGATTKLVNVWHGGGEVPAAARMVLSESMLGWTDYAEWDADDFSCSWRIETRSFKEAVSCAGKTRLLEQGSGTLMQIEGEIAIDASRIKGVPKLLVKSVSKTVEDFLVKRITPNLMSVSDGLSRYLTREAG